VIYQCISNEVFAKSASTFNILLLLLLLLLIFLVWFIIIRELKSHFWCTVKRPFFQILYARFMIFLIIQNVTSHSFLDLLTRRKFCLLRFKYPYLQGRIKTKLGLMLQLKKGLLFLFISACAFDIQRIAAHARPDWTRSVNCLQRNNSAFIEPQ